MSGERGGDGGAPKPSPTLSIVIPTLDEADRLPYLGRHLRAIAPDAEVVVVDGGSSDDTVQIARGFGYAVLQDVGPGRALQMNAGAAATQHDHLLFLHADTRLPAGLASLVAMALDDPAVALGAFRFRLDQRGLKSQWIELGVNLRSRVLGLPFGDQGLFLRRAVWDELGGYVDMPFMEDADFVRRAARLGRVLILPEEAVTSARLWQQHGLVKVTARNWWLSARFGLGWRPTSQDDDPLRRWSK